MARFAPDDDDKFEPLPPNPQRRPDTRPWMVRVRERRQAYEQHWLSCTECQDITRARQQILEDVGVTANLPRGHCPRGELLRTFWLTEPK